VDLYSAYSFKEALRRWERKARNREEREEEGDRRKGLEGRNERGGIDFGLLDEILDMLLIVCVRVCVCMSPAKTNA